MRAGTLNVSGGTITATTTDETTYEANGSGTTVVGAGIAISQHSTNNEIIVNVTGGEITGSTGIRIYFKYTGSDISDITIKFADETMTPKAVNGDDNYNYYIEYDVPSNKLSTMYTLEVSDGTNTYKMTYGALTYAYNKLIKDNTSDDDLKNLVKALYYYSNAADAYFK